MGIIDGRGGQNLNGETVSLWTQTPLDPRPRMIQLVSADNFSLYKITLQNSPKFHVFGTGNFLTVWDVKITAPTTSPNTDGIDPSGMLLSFSPGLKPVNPECCNTGINARSSTQ